jgi:hypothetical protein
MMNQLQKIPVVAFCAIMAVWVVGIRSEQATESAIGEDSNPVMLVSSFPPFTAYGQTVPAMGTLWRSQNNVIRLTFDVPLPFAPQAGQILIQEMLRCPTPPPPLPEFGPDLSAGFTFEVEDGTVLRIGENGSVLGHRRWYAIRNVGGWSAVADLETQFPVQVGDASGDNRVLQTDVGLINANVPCLSACGDQNRNDINGDGRVLQADVGEAASRVSSLPVVNPCGW